MSEYQNIKEEEDVAFEDNPITKTSIADEQDLVENIIVAQVT